MIKLICMSASAAFLIAVCAPMVQGGEIPAAVRKAADDGVHIFLKDQRLKGLQNLGFRSRSEKDNAYAGEGFQVFTILPDRLLNSPVRPDIAALVTPTNQWQFLINADGGSKALLTVDIMNNVWTPVSIGSAGLAAEISLFLERWPAASGYTYRLVRIYQAKAEFMELSREGRLLGVVPLGSFNALTGRKNKPFDPADIRAPKDLLEKARPAVERNLQGTEAR
jgi:hypothetical protein